MNPSRSLLLAAARSPRLRRFAEDSRLTRPVVNRFVAGASEADALQTARELLADDLRVSLDFLGEDTTSLGQAEATVHAYESVLATLAQEQCGGRVEVSVKLSAIGQDLAGNGAEVALANAQRICAAAAAAGTTVTLDMEDHTRTDATLATLQKLRTDYPSVGAVLQAYLRRTETDCRELATAGSRVRLCKGAYAEPATVAFRGAEVEASYRRCLDTLLAGAGYPMIATHDPAMVTAAHELIAQHGRDTDSYEFQMLYGVRPEAQRALADGGQRVRVYVPYGDEWYGYFMRRLAERPANLRFTLRALGSRT